VWWCAGSCGNSLHLRCAQGVAKFMARRATIKFRCPLCRHDYDTLPTAALPGAAYTLALD
jgi:hypothetical protein